MEESINVQYCHTIYQKKETIPTSYYSLEVLRKSYIGLEVAWDYHGSMEY